MTGNLSRTVLRGAGARESTCLPDLSKVKRYLIKVKKKPSTMYWAAFYMYYNSLIYL
ncbi:hypothetical protein SRABI82_05987 [Priestia megaterium]|nr:hypothetical protein SRABI82_05987 [Priestia megaterium]